MRAARRARNVERGDAARWKTDGTASAPRVKKKDVWNTGKWRTRTATASMGNADHTEHLRPRTAVDACCTVRALDGVSVRDHDQGCARFCFGEPTDSCVEDGQVFLLASVCAPASRRVLLGVRVCAFSWSFNQNVRGTRWVLEGLRTEEGEVGEGD